MSVITRGYLVQASGGLQVCVHSAVIFPAPRFVGESRNRQQLLSFRMHFLDLLAQSSWGGPLGGHQGGLIAQLGETGEGLENDVDIMGPGVEW